VAEIEVYLSKFSSRKGQGKKDQERLGSAIKVLEKAMGCQQAAVESFGDQTAKWLQVTNKICIKKVALC
jgi:hypothetical protein